jgi:hypothetical protein
VLLSATALGGCGDSWNPIAPISKFWEKATERDSDKEEESAPATDPVPEEKGGEDPSDAAPPEEAVDGEEADSSPAPSGKDQVPSDLAGVHWLHSDVSDWKESGNLRSVRVSGGTITLDYDKARSWPGVSHSGAFVNANPWIFVYQGGNWYAGTWEWLRHGQTSKSAGSVAGDHIKKQPLSSFRPKSGTVYGFMVSGLARDKTRNVKERTQVVMYRWP